MIAEENIVISTSEIFTMLGFDTETKCTVRGNDLLERFKKAQKQVRLAVEVMLMEAEQIASSESGHITYEDVFGMEEEE